MKHCRICRAQSSLHVNCEIFLSLVTSSSRDDESWLFLVFERSGRFRLKSLIEKSIILINLCELEQFSG